MYVKAWRELSKYARTLKPPTHMHAREREKKTTEQRCARMRCMCIVCFSGFVCFATSASQLRRAVLTGTKPAKALQQARFQGLDKSFQQPNFDLSKRKPRIYVANWLLNPFTSRPLLGCSSSGVPNSRTIPWATTAREATILRMFEDGLI